jgi:hypothetical protein
LSFFKEYGDYWSKGITYYLNWLLCLFLDIYLYNKHINL